MYSVYSVTDTCTCIAAAGNKQRSMGDQVCDLQSRNYQKRVNYFRFYKYFEKLSNYIIFDTHGFVID